MENETTKPNNKELARSLLEEAKLSIPDIATQTGLSIPAVQGLKGAMIKRLSRLQATQPEAKQSQAEFKPQNENQAENHDSPTLDGELLEEEAGITLSPLTHSPVSSSSNMPNIPEGYIIKAGLTPEEWKELASLDKSKLMSKVAELKAQNSSLQASAHMQPKHNGDEHSLSFYDEEMRKLELENKRIQNAQELEYQQSLREERMRARITPHTKEQPAQNTTQQVLDAVRIGVDLAVGKNGGKNDDAIFDRVVSIMKLIDGAKHDGQISAASNMYSMKEEEIKGIERLENKKLEWEERKWQAEQDNSTKTVDLLKMGLETFKEPIGNLISKVGSAGAERLRSQGVKTPTIDIKCPNCSVDFKGNPLLPQIQCSNCGCMLQSSQPASQPAQAEQPAPNQEENPISITTKPKIVDESVQSDDEVKNPI